MGRVLAIDYGSRKLGFAVSDESRLIVTSLPQILNDQELSKHLTEIIHKFQPETILLGYPSTDYDELTPIQRQILEFKNRLKKFTSSEIILFDESFSSEEAEKIYLLKKGKAKTAGKKQKDKKNQIDSLAAHMLLKSFLDSNR